MLPEIIRRSSIIMILFRFTPSQEAISNKISYLLTKAFPCSMVKAEMLAGEDSA